MSIGSGNLSGQAGNCAHVTAAERTTNQLVAVADRACAVASRLEDRLESVMSPDYPTCEEGSAPEESFPPLFAGYRGQVRVIESALSRIEACISRLEL